MEWGLYEGRNPVCSVKFRTEERNKFRILDVDEETRLLAAAREPLRSLILIGLHTGLRIKAEALTLKWSGIDLKRATLTVEAAYAKSGRTRTIPLDSIALNVLKALRGSTKGESAFVTKDGTPYRSIGSAFRRACRRAKIPGVTPHTLRHTFASRLVMAGVNLRTVQDLGGWRTIAMVERYSHLSEQYKADAVEQLVRFSCPSSVAGFQSLRSV